MAGTVNDFDTISDGLQSAELIMPARHTEFIRISQQLVVAVPVGAVA